MGKLGHLVESLRARARRPVNEDVIGSLFIIAKDVGGKGKNTTRGDFIGNFRDDKQAEKFLRTVRMEYPGIEKYIKRSPTSDGRIEMVFDPKGIRKYDR